MKWIEPPTKCDKIINFQDAGIDFYSEDDTDVENEIDVDKEE